MNKNIKKIMILFLSLSIISSVVILCFDFFIKNGKHRNNFIWPKINEHKFDDYINSYSGNYNFSGVKKEFQKQVITNFKKQGFNSDNIQFLSKNNDNKITFEVNYLKYNKKYFFNLIDNFV